MAYEYHHGVRVFETTAVGAAIRMISTAIIGLVATAPAANAEAFPLNVPVLLTNPAGSVGKAGAGGTLAKALQQIGAQTRAVVVVVRVEAGATPAETTTNVIGTTTATGQRTGIQALLSAQSELGVKPRILGAPDLDTKTVANALATACQSLRAFAYVAARGADGIAVAQTKEEATTYRDEFGQRELMVLWPRFLSWDTATSAIVESSPVAYAMGLRAKLDQTIGWHKSISNAVINGPEGISTPVFFDLQNPESDAGYLNGLEVTTIINQAGYRFWGSRTCEMKGGKFPFENYTRTAQIMADTIAEGHMAFIDQPMTPTLVKDMLGYINKLFRDMVNSGRIVGATAWFDPDKNDAASLAAGQLLISYDYTPTPGLENLIFEQSITETYLVQFAEAIASA